VLVGTSESGFLPFCCDVTDCLIDGDNEIKVRVESPTDDAQAFPDAPLTEIPFGKQSWYGPLSGIWQSVWLECRAVDHVERVVVRAALDSGAVALHAVCARPLLSDTRATARIFDDSGAEVAYADRLVTEGAEAFDVALAVEEPRAWSPDSPNLYRLELMLERGGTVIDRHGESFGFRTVEIRDGRLMLNGEPLYLRAALDQDYYPDTICTPPSLAFIEDQFRKAKELGLNCLRCHIKAPDPRYYEAADRLGLLVWTELPNGGLMTERSQARKEALLKGIVDRDGNHPSIICWTIINENWGVDLVHDANDRAWLTRTYDWLKAYDPTRLVVDNSALAPSFHVKTDLADFHFYAAIPDSRHLWDRFVEELAGRPSWLFSPHDATVTGREALLCSEFGNWGLPDPELLKDSEGREPWWFETGHDWGEGVAYAHGIENRFSDWSLKPVFGSLKGFVEAAQWQQFRALKYAIEAMRRQPALAGYVITEFTDCHWESNGLLDMRRNPRVFHERFRTINADTVIVPRWERTAYWSGETARLQVALAHGAGAPLERATLTLTLAGETLRLAVDRLDAGNVRDLGTVELVVPQVEASRREPILMVLTAEDGTVLARNEVEIAVHPPRAQPLGAALWASDEGVRAHLAALGYTLADSPIEAELLVATRHDTELAAYVRAGGKLLLLAEQAGSLNPFFPHWQAVKIVERDETLWKGDWVSTFAWLRRTGWFADLPGGPLLDETFDRVIPTHVISGCNCIDFQARVHAGLVIGWIHKPVALSVERGYGKGRLLASTFRLFRDAPGADPTATILLDRLIAQALAVPLAAAVELSEAAA
jgi:hypothetical protein